MKKIELKADIRDASVKLNDIRTNKQIPWVVYWHHQEPINLVINNSDLIKILNTVWKSHILSLEIGKKKLSVLIKEMQKHPVIWNVTHIDFYAITAWEKITTEIPLKFVWESEAKKLWAIIEEHLKAIEVKCQSEDLVDFFEIDLSLLREFEDVIRVSDLTIDSNKFEIQNKPEEIVVSANEPAVQVIEEEVPAAVETPAEWDKKPAEEK